MALVPPQRKRMRNKMSPLASTLEVQEESDGENRVPVNTTQPLTPAPSDGLLKRMNQYRFRSLKKETFLWFVTDVLFQ